MISTRSRGVLIGSAVVGLVALAAGGAYALGRPGRIRFEVVNRLDRPIRDVQLGPATVAEVAAGGRAARDVPPSADHRLELRFRDADGSTRSRAFDYQPPSGLVNTLTVAIVAGPPTRGMSVTSTLLVGVDSRYEEDVASFPVVAGRGSAP